jgi:hypothetical protein
MAGTMCSLFVIGLFGVQAFLDSFDLDQYHKYQPANINDAFQNLNDIF